MRHLLIATAIAVSGSASGVDCSVHKIYCRLVDLQPDINVTFAMELSNKLYRYSRRYGTDPMVSVAIGMQESSLRNIDRYETVIDSKGRYVRGVSDIGVFQLHVATIANLELDPTRLRNDLDYQVEQHVKLLRRKIRVCSAKGWAKGAEWSCYHSYSRSNRKHYENLVRRYL